METSLFIGQSQKIDRQRVMSQMVRQEDSQMAKGGWCLELKGWGTEVVDATKESRYGGEDWSVL